MSEWISGNRFLSLTQMQNNAKIILGYFRQQGWTDNSIYGMLGNMQSESSINPGIWEGLKPYKGGYGLVQWTPYTKYSEWAGEGWQDNGQKEMERILWESQNEAQWRTDLSYSYKMTFAQYTKSTKSPAYLADVWLKNYERPAVINQPKRGTQAQAWADRLTEEPIPQPPDVPVPTPEPEPEPPEGYTLKVPIWLLFKMQRWRGRDDWTGQSL